MGSFITLAGILGPLLLQIISYLMARGQMSAEASRKFITAIEAYQKESANFSVRMQKKYERMKEMQLELERQQQEPPSGGAA